MLFLPHSFVRLKTDSMSKTPVAFVIFKRPDTTAKVFEAIRRARPEKLFIIADGPRNEKEAELCEQTRAITDQIDWQCDVHRDYAEKNMGCRNRVVSGLNWVFRQVDEAIILEDDTVPHQDFFRFCTELLEKYEHNGEILSISGNNFQEKKWGDGSYYFSKYPHIWGWATWRRAWQLFDENITSFPATPIKDLFTDTNEQRFWKGVFQKIYDKEIDAWGYQWLYAHIKNKKLSAIPNVNLVSNIGFGEDATHTTKKTSKRSNIPTEPIGEITHPSEIKVNTRADKHTSNVVYGIRSFWQKVWFKLFS